MKKPCYTEEQIAFALKLAETGTWVEEVCRKMGISEALFYNWKKFGSIGSICVTELRRLGQLEEESHRLKQLVGDPSLDKEMLQDVIRKGSEAGAETRGVQIPSGGVPHWGSQYMPADDAEPHGLQLLQLSR